MKKARIFVVALAILLMLFGCSGESAKTEESSEASNNAPEDTKESTKSELADGFYEGDLTLTFSFGERTGTYKGDLVNALPEGYGEFTSTSTDDGQWTYQGQWKEGHFHGQGQIERSNGDKEIGMYLNDIITPMSEADTKNVFLQPEKYKGHCVELMGSIYGSSEKFDGGIKTQVFTDIENFENNALVYLYGDNILLKDRDVIKVKGLVGDVFVGENAFGEELVLPTVHSTDYEITSYDTLHPLIGQAEINETQTQLGYSITIQKIEVTDEESRLYVKAVNDGAAIFNLYSFNAKIIQKGKEYEEELNWAANHPRLEPDIDPGESTEGVIFYPPIELESFTILIEAYSDDFGEDFEDYIFDIEF